MLQEKTVTETTELTIAGLMRNYANYNLWANTTLINWLRTKAEDVVEQEVPSSFPGIKLTWVHICATEQYWLSVLNKTEPKSDEETNEMLEDVYTRVLETSAALADQLNAMAGSDLSDTTLIVNPWFQCDFQNFEYVMQVMNHSTYHRGQIITIGRHLGFTDAPMTDYNFYNVFGK